jgi:regulator of protease activity HflC (stomatin/prohibitin superfamily)
LPLPFERIYRYPVEQVNKIAIGGHDEEDHKKSEHADRAILWDFKEPHSHASVFIVADTSEPEGESSVYNTALRMSILSAHIPLYYKVKNLYDYAYRHQQSSKSLRNIACRELIRYMAGADFTGVLGHERYLASDILKKRIQEASNEAQLGIEVVFVGLVGLHPPVGVGAAFDNVVASRERQLTEMLQAETYAAVLKPATTSQVHTLRNAAEAYKTERSKVSEAESERFLSQLKGYQASPDLFVLSSYLDVMVNQTRNTRKYVLANSKNQEQEVVILNLEKKLKSSLLDLNLGNFENPQN